MSCRCPRKNQTSITETLVIPDNKPDIERVLRVTSTPFIKKTTVIHRKVILTGEINICVEYVAAAHCNSQPVHFASFRIPVTMFVDHPRAHAHNDAKILVAVEFQDVKIIDRRKLTLFLILKAVVLKLEVAKVLVKSQVSSSCQEQCQDYETEGCSSASCVIDCSKHFPCDEIECNLKC